MLSPLDGLGAAVRHTVVMTALFQCFFMALFLFCIDSVVDNSDSWSWMKWISTKDGNSNFSLAGYPLQGVKLFFKRWNKELIYVLVVYTLMLPYHLPHTSSGKKGCTGSLQEQNQRPPLFGWGSSSPWFSSTQTCEWCTNMTPSIQALSAKSTFVAIDFMQQSVFLMTRLYKSLI